MGNVVNIEEKRKNKEKIRYIFDNLRENKVMQNEIKEYDEYYEKLISDFYVIYERVKNNTWNCKSDDKFLEKYEIVIKDGNEEEKYINALEFIRLYDMLRDNLFKLKDRYLKIILYIPSMFEKVCEKDYLKLIKCLNNKVIMDELEGKNDFNLERLEILDYVDLISNGINPVEMVMFEDKEPKENTLDGILTIDKIYNFYINQAMFIKNIFDNFIDNEVMDKLEKIILIKKFNNSNQNKFIALSKIVNSSSYNIVSNIENMASLVDIFLYFDKDVDNIDLDVLKNMLFYMIINRKSINEIKEYYETNFSSKGLK